LLNVRDELLQRLYKLIDNSDLGTTGIKTSLSYGTCSTLVQNKYVGAKGFLFDFVSLPDVVESKDVI